MHWFAKYSNSLLQQQFLARPELKAHPSDRFDEICCSGDLVRVLHDRGAASRLSRVCLDFVQDERRVGRVEQVKSFWAFLHSAVVMWTLSDTKEEQDRLINSIFWALPH